MKRKRPEVFLGKITILIAGLWFFAFAAFAARQTVVTQVFMTLLTLALLGFGSTTFVLFFARWSEDRWRGLVPVGICTIAVVLAPRVGAVIRESTFRRDLPSYNAVIRQMERGSIPVDAELRRIPQAEGAQAYVVLAQRTSEGLNVEFITGGGFPVKHSGYLYCSSGEIERGSLIDSRWPKRREVMPMWFRISD